MDADADLAKKQALQQEESDVRAWLNHPITTSVLSTLDQNIESSLLLICNQPISNLETFFAHFELVGFLRATRNAKRLLVQRAEEIKEELEEIQ